eukprot:XP_001699851.1 predicted protein [Chlamydomonas reinhardtii]
MERKYGTAIWNAHEALQVGEPSGAVAASAGSSGLPLPEEGLQCILEVIIKPAAARVLDPTLPGAAAAAGTADTRRRAAAVTEVQLAFVELVRWLHRSSRALAGHDAVMGKTMAIIAQLVEYPYWYGLLDKSNKEDYEARKAAKKELTKRLAVPPPDKHPLARKHKTLVPAASAEGTAGAAAGSSSSSNRSSGPVHFFPHLMGNLMAVPRQRPESRAAAAWLAVELLHCADPKVQAALAPPPPSLSPSPASALAPPPPSLGDLDCWAPMWRMWLDPHVAVAVGAGSFPLPADPDGLLYGGEVLLPMSVSAKQEVTVTWSDGTETRQPAGAGRRLARDAQGLACWGALVQAALGAVLQASQPAGAGAGAEGIAEAPILRSLAAELAALPTPPTQIGDTVMPEVSAMMELWAAQGAPFHDQWVPRLLTALLGPLATADAQQHSAATAPAPAAHSSVYALPLLLRSALLSPAIALGCLTVEALDKLARLCSTWSPSASTAAAAIPAAAAEDVCPAAMLTELLCAIAATAASDSGPPVPKEHRAKAVAILLHAVCATASDPAASSSAAAGGTNAGAAGKQQLLAAALVQATADRSAVEEWQGSLLAPTASGQQSSASAATAAEEVAAVLATAAAAALAPGSFGASSIHGAAAAAAVTGETATLLLRASRALAAGPLALSLRRALVAYNQAVALSSVQHLLKAAIMDRASISAAAVSDLIVPLMMQLCGAATLLPSAAVAASPHAQMLQPSATAPATAAQQGGTASSARVPSDLTLTPTTQRNVQLIREAAESGVPLLLSGDTGVGKTATVAHVAASLGRKLVRFNLSSKVTTQDLIARPLLKAKAINGSVQGGGQEEELVMELQPFAAAFSQGHWLLLDEVNLAPDQVLAALELPLDRGVMEVGSASAGEAAQAGADATIVLRRHPDFRLFATQNPGAGG